MKKVILMGFYGGYNFGDEVILENIFHLYKEKLYKELITVCCLEPDYIKNRFSVHSFRLISGFRGMQSFFKEMRKNDLLIVGGGGLLQDYGNNPGPIVLIMQKVFVAILLRKPVIFYSIGVGPIGTMTGKFLTGIFCNFISLITVRDKESKELLHRLGVRKKRIHIIPDSAFGLKNILNRDIKKQGKKNNCIGISILPFFKLAHNDPYKDIKIRGILKELCNNLIEKSNYSILFFPCHIEPDNKEIISVLEGINNKNKAKIIHWRSQNSINYDFFEKIDFLISMRLHPQILAAIYGIPFISIVYHPKVKNLLRMLDYTNFSIDLEDITIERILYLLLKLKKHKEEISNKLLCKSSLISNELSNNKQLINSFL